MLASVALVLATVLLFLLLFRVHRAKNFPPGPRPIPILGNLLELNLENPIPDLERVKLNIVTIRMYKLPVFIY